jgi:type 1 glutamine amidotransferase
MRKALIVWGGWPGHEPEKGATIVARMLEEDGFAVDATPDLDAFARPDLGSFSLIVPNVTWHASQDTPVSDAAIRNLVQAVRGGVGFATFHGSAVAFPTAVDYHFMMGAQWVQHPGNQGVAYRVHIEKPFDPVMEGMADFDYRSEQYYLHVDPSIDVLATTLFTGEHDAAVTGVKMPVVYKRQFGQGRVFYSSLGHLPAEFETFPQAKTILRRGLNWAAR